ncbi:hypothetical protein BC829DRAFT_129899 [Chytridium lagenaria]|nr:hypothetical protein BC829DRAFT_129899 [Chytridium lagenaria]
MSTALERTRLIRTHLAADGAAAASNECIAPAPSTSHTGLLSNQVAIITGAGQGIGAAMAKLFAKEGASVVVADLDAAQEVVDDIKKKRWKSHRCLWDVTDPAFPEKLVAVTIQTFAKINHIINNAGFTFDGMIHKMTDKQWEIMQSEEWGAFNVRVNTIAFGLIDTRLTRAKETGDFIEIEGEKVKLGIPIGNTKLGDMMAARAKMIPLQRAGQAEEAAAAALFLCSPFSTYVTGHCLEVTGGAGI